MGESPPGQTGGNHLPDGHRHPGRCSLTAGHTGASHVRMASSARTVGRHYSKGDNMGLEDLKKQAEEGFEKVKETVGEENVEKAVEAAKEKATEVASDLKDKFTK